MRGPDLKEIPFLKRQVDVVVEKFTEDADKELHGRTEILRRFKKYVLTYEALVNICEKFTKELAANGHRIKLRNAEFTPLTFLVRRAVRKRAKGLQLDAEDKLACGIFILRESVNRFEPIVDRISNEARQHL